MGPRIEAMKEGIIGLLLPAVVACGGAAPKPEQASDSDSAQAATGEPPEDDAQEPKRAGGYEEAPTDREDIVETAAHAVELLKTRSGDGSLALQSIERGETQVVAGRNTRLTLVLTGSTGEKTVTVVVYRNLDGAESLTSVEGL